MGCSTNSKHEKSKSTDQSEDYVEDVVCKVSDLKENEPKVFPLDEGKVLVIKQNGKINAIGNECTHSAAPLESSAVGDGRLRCKFHGACFNIETGDIEDFPGLDSLPCYQVKIDNDNVRVRAKKSLLIENKRVKPMVKRNKNVTKHIVVIGGGPSGAACVEALRQEGYDGRLTMVCRENYLPYDRVKVSKAIDFKIEQAQFRDINFYKSNDIEVLTGVEATGVNANSKTVSLSNGDCLNYDKLYIATGSKPRRLNVPGADLKNIAVLRDYSDAQQANTQIGEDKEVVVFGSSFIAMEAASFCVGKVKKVTVVFRDNVPFKKSLGPRIGAAVLSLFKDRGVNFVVNNIITKVNGNSNEDVDSVELKDGTILKADLLILGLGSTFYTDFLKESGIEVRSDGTIETNEFLQTNQPDVYVGGDIAYSPVWCHGDEKAAIGHFPLAQYHGKIAALNMVGKQQRVQNVPFFWTMFFGKGFRFAGYGDFDEIIYSGNVEEFKFVAFYLKDGVVVSTSACGMDPVVSQYAEYVIQGKKLSKEHLVDNPLSWITK